VALLAIRLVAHLTEASLSAALLPISQRLEQLGSQAGLVVDCLQMSGYDAAARSLFVEWNRAHRDRLCAIGIVTRKLMWHVVISSMALASGQRMKAFGSVRDAEVWLAHQAT
jgi:ABC-type transporter Mla MlaB component